MTEYWKRRRDGDWRYYSPAYDEQVPHPMWHFLRLIQKSSGEWMLEARRSRKDKWSRIAIGHGFYDVQDNWQNNWPSVDEAIKHSAAAGLLPDSLT